MKTKHSHLGLMTVFDDYAFSLFIESHAFSTVLGKSETAPLAPSLLSVNGHDETTSEARILEWFH